MGNKICVQIEFDSECVAENFMSWLRKATTTENCDYQSYMVGREYYEKSGNISAVKFVFEGLTAKTQCGRFDAAK